MEDASLLADPAGQSCVAIFSDCSDLIPDRCMNFIALHDQESASPTGLDVLD